MVNRRRDRVLPGVSGLVQGDRKCRRRVAEPGSSHPGQTKASKARRPTDRVEDGRRGQPKRWLDGAMAGDPLDIRTGRASSFLSIMGQRIPV
jgi:hypothetical protein